MKPSALALMGAASLCAGVRRKRYSGQQEIAPYLTSKFFEYQIPKENIQKLFS